MVIVSIVSEQASYVVGIHWNCLLEAIPICTYNICPFNKNTSQLRFMFQCNEHVEMNKFCIVWHAPSDNNR